MLLLGILFLSTSVVLLTGRVLFSKKETDATQNENTRNGNPTIPILGVLLVPVVAILMYVFLGNSDVAKMLTEDNNAAIDGLRRPFDPNAHLELINDKLNTRPDDPNLLSQVSRLYMMVGKFDMAVESARRLVAIESSNAQSLVQLADALAMASNGQITDEITKILENALALESTNTVAMTLLGIGYEQRGKPEVAVRYWQKALKLLPSESTLKSSVEEMIAQTTLSNKVEKDEAELSVRVRVEISPELVSSLNKNEKLFVMLKNNGLKPPIVASKSRVTNFPFDIELNDSLSMLPGVSINNFNSIYALARISRSGSPLAKKGDLEGKSTSFNPIDTKSIFVVIDTIIE